jgi:hypothetical protein
MRALQLVYFMAPAYAANMLPPFGAHWRGWNPPVSERWLGSHKTVLGFALGVGRRRDRCVHLIPCCWQVNCPLAF